MSSPEDLAGAEWHQLRPIYEELSRRAVDAVWLRDWSRLEDLIAEAAALARIRYLGDPQNVDLRSAELRFSSGIKPAAADMGAELSRKLLESGYSEPGLETVLAQMRNQVEILVPENVSLLGEEAERAESWQRTIGGLRASWEGEQVPLYSLIRYATGADRDVRRRAWMAMIEPVAERIEELDSLLESLVDLRVRIASNAACDSYSEYARRMRNRIDFSLAETDRLTETVLEAWTPVLFGWRRRMASRLAVATIRPWDAGARLPPKDLSPYDTTDDLITTFERVFNGVHPRFGSHFAEMRRDGLLDLDFKANSPPIALNSRLHFSRKAHIFMGLPASDLSVRIVSHEAGHSFHFLESSAYDLHWQRLYNSMAAEFASTTMQLLVIGHMQRSKGGFYSDEDARISDARRLRDALVLPVGHCIVHSYERWLYDNPTATVSDRSSAWSRISERQRRGEDWNGIEQYVNALRCRTGTMYAIPFYDFDYMVAWLGALQVWRNYLQDPAGAVNAYLDALRLGNTRAVREVYATAGARIDLDADEVRGLVSFAAERVEELETPSFR